MGNNRTIDQYCGQDPYFDVLHDVNNKILHFPGCGLTKDKCTKRPCCVDAFFNGLGNQYNSSTCDGDLEKPYIFFDPVSYAFKENLTTCLGHFFRCFKNNFEDWGHCCQCKKGWTGQDCNTAVCFDDLKKYNKPMCYNGGQCTGIWIDNES